jgi:hypothetical protein
MKTKILLSFSVFVIAALVSFPHAGGPARVAFVATTGAPGEVDCASCHRLGNYSGDIFIREYLQNAVVNGYLPGAPHLIVVEVLSQTPFPIGGIQFQALDTAGNVTGYFLPGNAANTARAQQQYLLNGRQYIEHDRPVIPVQIGPAYRIFVGATWNPSPFYRGPVTFYAAGALCDGDGTVIRDIGMKTQLTLLPVRPLAADSLAEEGRGEEGKNRFRLESNLLTMTYQAEQPELLSYQLSDLQGQSLTGGSWWVEAGENSLKVPFFSSLPAGIYLLRIQPERGKEIVKPLIVH